MNPLGSRAVGEGGTTLAIGIVINAIVDALAVYTIEHIEMLAMAPNVLRATEDVQSYLAATRKKVS